MPVSIHAPAWGATGRHRGIHPDHLRFNPRTRVGCDARRGQARGPPARFNPRTRVGCDVLVSRGDYGIHQRFNPRTRVGCDLSYQYVAGYVTKFQSTHPRGVRRVKSEKSLCDCQSFNPRTRVGCDGRILLLVVRMGCFNPRTRVGCDCILTGGRKSMCRFQSTHPRGVRRVKSEKSLCDCQSFNPRTRVGCDSNRGFTTCRTKTVSIHAPAWGATAQMQPLSIRQIMFQSTHPRGVRRPWSHWLC